MIWYVMLCHALLCHDIARLCYVVFCHARVMFCHVLLCHVVFCRVYRVCVVLSCSVMLVFCSVMFCCVMLYSIVFVEGARRETRDHRDNLWFGGRGMQGGFCRVCRGREAGDPGPSGQLGVWWPRYAGGSRGVCL